MRRLTRDRFTLNEPMQEVWRPVVGWKGFYEVSDLGRVRSLDREVVYCDGRVRRHLGKVLKAEPNNRGYCKVDLRRNGQSTTRNVHSLVAEAFLGACPVGLIVRHGDGGQRDNRAENLSYGTHFQNNGPDKERDGTLCKGEQHPFAKLTDAQVRHVRQQLENGPFGTGARLARELGVSKFCISAIKLGKNRAHV